MPARRTADAIRLGVALHAVRRLPRRTWAFASTGVGVEVGRAFIPVNLDQPIASQGPVLVPINVEFRFWE